jgi:hypothetical protein
MPVGYILGEQESKSPDVGEFRGAAAGAMLHNISPAVSELGDLGSLDRVTFLLEIA